MWLRGITTISLFTLIFVFVSPIKAFEKVLACDKVFLLSSSLLIPIFLFFRIFKWFLLARQIDEQIRVKEFVSDYLWGMALGLVTPGRVGEVSRIKHIRVSRNRGVALYILEKFLEVTALFFLCLPGLFYQSLVPVWILFSCLIAMPLIVFTVAKVFNLMGTLKKIRHYIEQFKTSGCWLLSLLCLLVFCIQGFLILRGMNENISPMVIIFIPWILIGNLIPVTIGGFGARESLAILFLKEHNISSEEAMSFITLVGLLNLVLPALVGAVLNLNRKATHE
jgi:glycosyltransferase 2 family protein